MARRLSKAEPQSGDEGTDLDPREPNPPRPPGPVTPVVTIEPPREDRQSKATLDPPISPAAAYLAGLEPIEGNSQEAQPNPNPPPPRGDGRSGAGEPAQKPAAGIAQSAPPRRRTKLPPIVRHDFVVEISRKTEGGYQAKVLESMAGRAHCDLDLPFGAQELDDHLHDLREAHKSWLSDEGRFATKAEIRSYLRRHARELEARFGSALYAAAFQDEVRARFEQSWAALRGMAVATEQDQGLRLRIFVGAPAALKDPAETAALARDLTLAGSVPWEYLFEATGDQRLACDRRTPIVRSLDPQGVVVPARAKGPLRVLVVDSAPTDQRQLITESERRDLRHALEEQDLAQVESVTNPSRAALRELLRTIRPHILHFIGHGSFDSGEGEGYLCLADEHLRTDPLYAEELAELVKDFEVRLVFLNSCRTAQFPRRNGQDPWGSIAAALLRKGIPAVIAMQFPISNNGAVAFSRGFYRSVAAGDPVDVAVVEGRVQLRDEAPWEWGIPVLYLNTPTGDLFDLAVDEDDSSDPSRDRETRPVTCGVRSIVGWGRDMKKRLQHVLLLDPYFEGRYIREPELWEEKVAPELSRFLNRRVAGDRPIELELAAHQSLAFLAGYVLHAAGGLDLSIVQRSEGRNPVRWRMDEGEVPDPPLWVVEEKALGLGADVAIAVGITHPTLADVEAYIVEEKLPIGRLVGVRLAAGFGQKVVKLGAHADALAQELANLIDARSPQEKRQTLHLFGSAPNAFFLFLGSKARGFGKVQLYEFDLERVRHGTYEPSLLLPLASSK